MPPSHGARRRRTAVRVVTGALVLTAAVGAGTAGVAGLLGRLDHQAPVERCEAVADGTSWYLATDQADTAALLAGTSLRREMPARAATIAIATGLQESKLRNIDYGDRDSVGIFQQRPSQGWGTVEEIMDPVFATNAFYDALAKVDGYEEMAVTEAAQTVQRSAFPDAYAQHEARSRAWASALTGWSPAALTCTLPAPEGPGDPQQVVTRLDRDLGLAASVEAAGPADAAGTTIVRVDASTAPEPARAGWAVAHWSVAVAGTLGVVEVHHGDQVWVRADGAWRAADDGPLPAGQVRITLAG